MFDKEAAHQRGSVSVALGEAFEENMENETCDILEKKSGGMIRFNSAISFRLVVV